MSAAAPQWTAIVLAGQRPEGDPLAAALGQRWKALIPINGRSMLARVTDALLASAKIGNIVILAQSPDALLIGDTLPLATNPAIRLGVSQARIAASIAAIAGTQLAPWPLFVTTADHALLTPAMVDLFLEGADRRDLSVGVCERATVEARYPETRRTWLKFSDGQYSGANLFAFTNDRVLETLALWSEVEQHRKRAFRLFTRFGPRLLVRALTRTISFGEAIRRAGLRLGVDAAPVILPQAEAAIDVDKIADVALAESILARRESDAVEATDS